MHDNISSPDTSYANDTTDTSCTLPTLSDARGHCVQSCQFYVLSIYEYITPAPQKLMTTLHQDQGNHHRSSSSPALALNFSRWYWYYQ